MNGVKGVGESTIGDVDNIFTGGSVDTHLEFYNIICTTSLDVVVGKGEESIKCETEKEIFDALGLEFVEPVHR